MQQVTSLRCVHQQESYHTNVNCTKCCLFLSVDLLDYAFLPLLSSQTISNQLSTAVDISLLITKLSKWEISSMCVLKSVPVSVRVLVFLLATTHEIPHDVPQLGYILGVRHTCLSPSSLITHFTTTRNLWLLCLFAPPKELVQMGHVMGNSYLNTIAHFCR